MSDRPPPPFAEQERDLLTELAGLFALRSERERALASRLRSGLAEAETRHRRVTQEAADVCEKSLASAVARHGEERAKIETAFRSHHSGAATAMEKDLSAFNERTRSLAEAIDAKLKDSKWLAETMLESGEGRARAAFEAAKRSITHWIGQFDAAERVAASALESGGHAPMRPGTPSSAAPPATASGLGDVAAAAEGVRQAAAGLEGALHPRFLEPLGVLGLLLAGVVAGAGIAAAMDQGALQDPAAAMPQLLEGAGIGAIVGLVVLLIGRAILRGRVPAAAQAMSDALFAARETATRALDGAAAVRDGEIGSLRAGAEKEWTGAQASVATLTTEVKKRRTEHSPQLRSRHERGLAKLVETRDRDLAEVDRRLETIRMSLEAALAAARSGADEALADSRRQLQEADATDRAELERTWSERIGRAMRCAEELEESAGRISPGWNPAEFESMPEAELAPPGVKFGTLRLDMAALPGGLSPDPRLAVPGRTARELPVMIDLLGRGSVLLRATPEQRGRALATLNNIVLRLLTGLPPGKVRCTIVDPIGLGQSFAGLMHLSDYEEALVGERIWTDPRHIEQRMTDLTEHMETVIQKYLRNEYETIQAYNAEAGEVAEPYRFLVIADLPASITDGAAKRLASIATSGARCGVFLLAMTTQSAGRDGGGSGGRAQTGHNIAVGSIPWADIERNSVVLRLSSEDSGGTRWTEEPFAAWPIELEAPPDEPATMRLLHRIGEHAKDSTRVRVPFSIVEPEEGKLWSGDTASEIRLPLGRAGAKKVQHMTLGPGTAQHTLIAGRTGSGKSTLLHVIVTTAALWYSPDQVELYLVDFKKGVEFKTYAAHRLPHARVVAIESEREFGLSVLRRLDGELTRRGELFRSAAVQDLAGYRQWQARSGDRGAMPRVLLVVDEFQEFFVEDDRLAQDSALLLDRLVRQGRAFGIHVILGSQTLAGAYTLARSTLGQMAVRIALQCSESDSYLILSEDNPAPRLLSRPGEAIYNDTSGLIEGNSPFQIVWLPDEVRDRQLERVQRAFQATGRPAPPQIVFEGNVPGDLARNPQLSRLLEWTTERKTVRTAPVLWLGEPLAIKDPTGIALRRQSASNTLVVGHQEEHAAAVCASAIVSLAAWLRSEGGEGREPGQLVPAVTILDATPSDVPHADLLPGLAQRLNGMARAVGLRGADEALGALCAEIERRNASGHAEHSPAILVVHGLHRFRELRRPDDYSYSSDPDKPPSPAQRLATILRSGPPVGVHTLAWCDTATNVDRMLERSALREFGSRVLMQMNAGDSTQLTDSPLAATLGLNRALLYSDDTGTIEKFRLYATPSPEWLDRVMHRLASPSAAP